MVSLSVVGGGEMGFGGNGIFVLKFGKLFLVWVLF